MPKIFYYLRKAKNSYVTVPFMYNFEVYLINSLRLSEVQFFKLHTPLNVMERGIRKSLTFVICQNASKVFEKIILKPL